MYELIYCSKAVSDISETDIANILQTARSFNSKNNITGCLLYYKHEFVQILEGEKSIIKTLYSAIEKDPRHNRVTLLAEGEKQERFFDNWNMAYHKINADDFDNIENLLFVKNFLALSNLATNPTKAIELFWYMSNLLLKNEK